MQPYSALSLAARSYVGLVVAIGSLILGVAVAELYAHPIGGQWLLLGALTLLSGSFTVKVPSIPATISVSETFVLIILLLFGPQPAIVTVALEGLIISLWIQRRNHETYRIFFNMAAPVVSIWIAWQLSFALLRVAPLSQIPADIGIVLPSLALFTLLFFLLNSWLVTLAVSFERTGVSILHIWKNNFLWLSLNYFGGASVAVLLVQYTRDINLSALGLIIPLLVISYLTFKTSMGRVEDANRHLDQMNSLYLSTIETLAMAIDAKDQITHGHIRRVQTYAVGLARRSGIKDEAHIKAIEAAALLHDMGKLAVPEYILNKPGREI